MILKCTSMIPTYNIFIIINMKYRNTDKSYKINELAWLQRKIVIAKLSHKKKFVIQHCSMLQHVKCCRQYLTSMNWFSMFTGKFKFKAFLFLLFFFIYFIKIFLLSNRRGQIIMKMYRKNCTLKDIKRKNQGIS